MFKIFSTYSSINIKMQNVEFNDAEQPLELSLGVKVKWSRYRPSVTQTYGRRIALLFHDRGTERFSVQQHAPAAIYPLQRIGTYIRGGLVGVRVGLEGRKFVKSGFDPVPSRPGYLSRYTDWATPAHIKR